MLKMERGGVRARALPRLRCSFRGSPRPALFESQVRFQWQAGATVAGFGVAKRSR